MPGSINVVAHNLQSMFSNRQLGITELNKAKSAEKLASGYKINRAADDAAGLAISEKMRRQIRGLKQGTDNTQDGISLCQVADSALSEVSEMLHRITELSVQASNDTNDKDDRQAIQAEINQILKEIDRVSDTTTFNEKKIFCNPAVEKEGIDPEKSKETKRNEALQKLLKGTFDSVTAPIEVSPGQSISADDANAIIQLLSNVAIMGGALKRYEESYKGVDLDTILANAKAMQKYLGEKTDILTDNCKVGCNYIDNENYVADINSAGNMMKNGWARYPYSVEYYDSARLDYNHCYNLGIRADSPVAAFASLGMSEVADTFRDYNYNQRFEGRINRSTADFSYAIERLLNSKGIRSGKIYDSISRIFNSEQVINPEVNGQDVMDIATDIYLMMTAQPEIPDNPSEEGEIVQKNVFWIQSGCEPDDGMYLEFGYMDTDVLGISEVSVLTGDKARETISRTKNALGIVSEIRSDIGAQQNRLEHTVKRQENTVENTIAAESRIRDTDMASEMVKYSNNSVLSQAGQSILAQANQSNQGVISLLQ